MNPKAEQFLKTLQLEYKKFEQYATKEEFVKNFEIIIKLIKDLKTYNSTELNTIKSVLTSMFEKMKEEAMGEMDKTHEKMMSDCEAEMDKMKKDREAMKKEMEVKMDEMKEECMPDNDLIAKMASKMAQDSVLPLIPKIEAIENDLPRLGGNIASALELLPDGEKLKMEAIEGLKELLEELKNRKVVGGGGGGYSKIAADMHDFHWTTIGTGDGTTSVFTLSIKPNPIESLEIVVGNSYMFVTDDFTYSASTGQITFLTDSIPANGAKIRQKCKR